MGPTGPLLAFKSYFVWDYLSHSGLLWDWVVGEYSNDNLYSILWDGVVRIVWQCMVFTIVVQRLSGGGLDLSICSIWTIVFSSYLHPGG